MYTSHSLVRQLWFTEGVKQLREEKQCYWLIDVIASYYLPGGPIQTAGQRFQDMHFWYMAPDGNGGALIEVVEDSGLPPVVTQTVGSTDFEFDGDQPLQLFCGRQEDENGGNVWILMLPEEY